MTRDSKVLPVLQVSAIVLALVVANITDPAAWGVSPVALKWLGLLSTVIGTVAGFLGTSPLKGANDANSVTPPRLPVVLLAIALGGALTFGVSCGGAIKPAQLPSQAAAVVQSGDALAKAGADHALGILDAAGKVLNEVITVEKKVEPLMSVQMKADTRKALNAVNDQIENAAKAIKVGVRSEAQLKAVIDPVIAAAQRLATLVGTLPVPTQSRFGFGSLVQMLLTVFGAPGGAPLPEGAL